MKKVFIDGRAGTTGLRIYERLEERPDLSLLVLSEEKRKDPVCRAQALNEADIAFLCLPDEAAREAVLLAENPDTVWIDTSTAHRTQEGWVYGFPEIWPDAGAALASSHHVAVPGCHASGFIALIRPLLEEGLLSKETALSCHSLTGYSGGGKKMIAEYEDAARDALLDAPRPYGLTQNHKHLKEMKTITGLTHEPIFCPIVADYYSGMVVTVPLFVHQLNGGSKAAVEGVYEKWYHGPVVRYRAAADEAGFLSAAALSGKDSMEVTVCGNEERLLLIARYDNLGKGASGAAIQCMNLSLGVDQTTGLCL